MYVQVCAFLSMAFVHINERAQKYISMCTHSIQTYMYMHVYIRSQYT